MASITAPRGALVYNVRDHGAAGDGLTNDQAAVQTAINAVQTAGGGAVYFPAGVYLLNSPVQLQSGVSLWGASRASVTLLLGASGTGGVNTVVLYATSALVDVTLEKFTVDCNSLGAGINIVATGNQNLTLRQVAVKNAVNAVGAGIFWPVAIGAIVSHAAGTPSVNVVLDHCDIGNNTPLLENCILINCTHLRVTNNYFHDVIAPGPSAGIGATGLAIYAYCHDIIVQGNSFSNIGTGTYGGGGIDCYIQQNDACVYANNIHYRTVAGAISLSLMQMVAMTVTGCSFFDSVGTSVGIMFGDVLDSVSANNFATNKFNSNAALYDHSQNVTVAGCQFYGPRQAVLVYSPVVTATLGIVQQQVNRMSDITITDCDADNLAAGTAGAGIVAFQVGGPAGVQNIRRVEMRNCRVGGNSSYNGGSAFMVQGNPGFTATTTAQVITASAARQVVTLASVPTGLIVGQWIVVDTAGNLEDVWVVAVSGSTITGVFNKAHASGVAVALSSTVVAKGIANARIKGGSVGASTAGTNVGVSLNSAAGVRVEDVDMSLVKAAGGLPILPTNGGSYARAANNAGYNPVGVLTPPAVSASTTPLVNPFNLDCMVYVAGGTVTAVALGGVSTGQTGGPFFVAAGTAITLTFSVAPAWDWVAT